MLRTGLKKKNSYTTELERFFVYVCALPGDVSKIQKNNVTFHQFKLCFSTLLWNDPLSKTVHLKICCLPCMVISLFLSIMRKRQTLNLICTYVNLRTNLVWTTTYYISTHDFCAYNATITTRRYNERESASVCNNFNKKEKKEGNKLSRHTIDKHVSHINKILLHDLIFLYTLHLTLQL